MVETLVCSDYLRKFPLKESCGSHRFDPDGYCVQCGQVNATTIPIHPQLAAALMTRDLAAEALRRAAPPSPLADVPEVEAVKLWQEVYDLARRSPYGDEIRHVFMELLVKVLRKNIDYDASAMKPPTMSPTTPVEDAMLCKMSDKVNRITTLASRGAHRADGVGHEVPETFQDAVQDLAGHALCMLAYYRRKRTTAETPVKETGPKQQMLFG